MENSEKMQLKIVALTQRISEIVAEYEGRVADLRVELTAVTNEKNELVTENGGLKMQIDQMASRLEGSVGEEESPAGDDS